MPTQREKSPTLNAWLEDELVPLERAAISAYFDLSASEDHMHGEEFLAEVVPLVAAALAAVAPIYVSGGADRAPVVLTPAEVEDLVFKPSRGGQGLAFERLSIRRKDLQHAMRVLGETRKIPR